MGRLSPVPPAAKIERQASRLTNDWAICQSQTGPLSFWSRGQQPRGVCTRRRLWAAARDLQTEGRRRRWRDATHKSAPLFPLATGEQYDALTFANKKKFRAAGRCTLDKLDQQAAEEKTRAQKNLFHPCTLAGRNRKARARLTTAIRQVLPGPTPPSVRRTRSGRRNPKGGRRTAPCRQSTGAVTACAPSTARTSASRPRRSTTPSTEAAPPGRPSRRGLS